MIVTNHVTTLENVLRGEYGEKRIENTRRKRSARLSRAVKEVNEVTRKVRKSQTHDGNLRYDCFRRE